MTPNSAERSSEERYSCIPSPILNKAIVCVVSFQIAIFILITFDFNISPNVISDLLASTLNYNNNYNTNNNTNNNTNINQHLSSTQLSGYQDSGILINTNILLSVSVLFYYIANASLLCLR